MNRILLIAFLSVPSLSQAGGVPLNQSIFNALDVDGITLRCFGTEPFWSLSFAKTPTNQVTLTQPAQADQTVPFTYAQQNGSGLVQSSFATTGGLNGTVTYVPAMNCSDGMSDFNYSFATSVTFPPSMSLGLSSQAPLQGCCQIQP